MKLKTLVSSMVALGLVSVAHAAPDQKSVTHHHHKHLKKVAVKAEQQAQPTQQVQNLNARVAALEAIVNRNQDNVTTDPKNILGNTDWYRAITVSGELEPILEASNRNAPNFANRTSPSSVNGTGFLSNDSTSTLSMNTMELYIDAQVNDFTKAHTALTYGHNPDKFATTAPGAEFFFSEANVQFANFAKSGFYSTVGKQYFNFGSYQHDSINDPFTEVFAKTQGVGLTGGYISHNGFDTAAYVFNGNLDRRYYEDTNSGTGVAPDRLRTWGASAGYTMLNRVFGVRAELGYLSNLAESIFFSQSVYNFRTGTQQTYAKAVPAMSAHVDLSSGPFDLIVDYIKAVGSFSANDLSTYQAGNNSQVTHGAQPYAVFTQLDYSFNTMGHASKVYTGYQQTGQAQNVYSDAMGGFYTPRSRISAGYNYAVDQNVGLKLELDHDQDYKTYTGTTYNIGSGRTSEGLVLGVDVKF